MAIWPIDHEGDLRSAIVSFLKNDTDLSAIVNGRVYTEIPPVTHEWPFIRYGVPFAQPFEASGWSGSEHNITVHAFARGPSTDSVSALAKQIVKSMMDFSMSGPISLVGCEWTGTKTLTDVYDSRGAVSFHSVIQFNVITSEGSE